MVPVHERLGDVHAGAPPPRPRCGRPRRASAPAASRRARACPPRPPASSTPRAGGSAAGCRRRRCRDRRAARRSWRRARNPPLRGGTRAPCRRRGWRRRRACWPSAAWSAGTRLRLMRAAPRMPHRRCRAGSRHVGADRVVEHAEVANLDFDAVARLQENFGLRNTPTPSGVPVRMTSPGSRVMAREMNAMMCARERSSRWCSTSGAYAVDAALNGQRLRVGDLVGGDDDRAERTERVGGLAAHPLLVAELHVARRDVVGHCVAEHCASASASATRCVVLPMTTASSAS